MSNSHRKRAILETCAMVADSHGKIGEAIASAIRSIDIDDGADGEEKPTRRKYLYRQSYNAVQYLYFRMPNGTLIRLPDNEHSVEFSVIYKSCLEKTLREKKKKRQHTRSAG
jgi:hypothetical protein